MARNRSLRRPPKHRLPKRLFLIFCEGKRTEPQYIKGLGQVPEIRTIASLERGKSNSDPASLVRQAIKARNSPYYNTHEIWCLFDVEWPARPNLLETVRFARSKGIQCAVSNPCFELWLILHFKDLHKSLTVDRAVELRQEHDKSVDKSVDPELYMDRRDQAATRARRLDAKHTEEERSFPKDNPSSGMYKLLDAFTHP